MSDADACRLPTRGTGDEAAAIARMLAGRRIAVVGLSDDPYRPSHGVASYLKSAGYEVLPVNPNCKTVLGLPCYPTLADVPGPIDVVDVFRRPEFAADVAREAVAAGAKGIWLQQGVRSREAERVAHGAGLDFVQDRCIKIDHMMRDRG
ncbi:MAG: CoA-binding protein [Phycisphaerales bacterium]|nr:CoA-binding protein [Phycisphaerales bacterium]